MRTFIVLLCVAVPVVAQNVVVSVKGGLGTADLTEIFLEYPESRPYRIGPALAIELPRGSAIEADALYSRIGRTFYDHRIGDYCWARLRANSWEFSVLLKYRLPLRRVHPALAFGVAPRTATGRTDVTGLMGVGFEIAWARSYDGNAKNRAWVVAGGFEFRAAHVRIAPELRWLRWNGPLHPTPDGFSVSVPANEIQLLVGIGWSVRK